MRRFIAIVDRMNRWIGRIVMYGIFVMMGILLWSSFSKTFTLPSLWTLEMAQFAMVAYYILGGPYSIQLGSNVRMDLIYGEWSDRKKAMVDGFSVFFLIFYLVVLLWGGLSSLSYSLGNFSGDFWSFFGRIITGFFTGGIEGATEPMGFIERSSTAWRPVIWPIKLIMCTGVFLMLLQCLSEFFKDILRIRGQAI
ncbi:TRAP transporter small permease subunit [Pseudooceanicola sp.]|uniref:TRAP transporter small permease subunit n=1 Tax=Pseudooceanicola sp. TaxID=1914328 RepID=UPI00261FAB20|nr:TRAP transporter small permease subunit [Pseudooceanicola sp.]MDF1856009.1 TRAP transporter small permease subunit [Pseudooceanicola sp.]